MMGCLVPRRECPCQAERRAREEAIKEQAAFLNKAGEEVERVVMTGMTRYLSN